MIGKLKIFWIVFLALGAFAAESKTYRLSSAHGSVGFSIPYMQVSKVEGRFKKYDGFFEYKNKKLSKIKVEIYTHSIDTADKKRDQHLQGKDFFEVSKFPKMKFIANKVEYKKETPSKVTGELTIRNVTRTVELKLSWKGVTQDPWKKTPILFFDLEGEIDRKVFSLKWNKALDRGGVLIGDKVKIKITVEAHPSDKKPAFSRFYKATVKPQKRPLELGIISQKLSPVSRVEKKEALPRPVQMKFSSIAIGLVLFFTLGGIGFIAWPKLEKVFSLLPGPNWFGEFLAFLLIFCIGFAVTIFFAPFMA